MLLARLAFDGGYSSVSGPASTNGLMIDHLALCVWNTRLVGARINATFIRDVASLGVQAVVVADTASLWRDDG